MHANQIRSNFFNTFWLYAAGIVLLVGVVGQHVPITLLAASVFATSGISWLWAKYSLRGLQYSRQLSVQRAFRGDVVTLVCRLDNHSWLPLASVDVEEQISNRIRPVGKEALPSNQVASSIIRHSTPLRWKQRVTWTVELECRERGAHVIGPAVLRSGDPFGFFTTQVKIDNRTSFLVYPDVVQLPEFRFPPDHPVGERRIPHHLLTDPIRVIGVRDYAPDDPIRHIHWKASARLQEMQVKVFEPTVSLQLGVFLSLDTFERYWEGVDSVRAESAIVAAASLASEALDRKSTVGVYVNGVIVGSDQTLRVAPSRGPRQLERILEGLARLSPMATTNFPRLLATEIHRLPIGSTIVVISCLMTHALSAAIKAAIDDGYRVILVTVGEVETPNIPLLHVETVPARLNEASGQYRHRYARIAGHPR